MSNTLIVTLGGNIGNNFMGADNWYHYQDTICSALCTDGCDIVQRPDYDRQHSQIGCWLGEVKEVACTFVCLTDDSLDLDLLRDRIGFIGKTYSQECIGWMVCNGQDNLIHCNL